MESNRRGGVEVIEEAGEVTRHRAAYGRLVDERYAYALPCVRKGEWVPAEFERAMAERRELAVRALRRITHGEGEEALVGVRGRFSAAWCLAGLGDGVGEEFLFRGLGSRSANARKASLEKLRQYPFRGDFSVGNRAAAACACVADEDAEVRKAAVDACSWRRVPGAEAAMVRWLERGDSGDVRGTVEALCRVVATPDGARAVLKHVPELAGAGYDSLILYYLRRAMKVAGPDVAETLREAVRRYTDHFQVSGEMDESSGSGESADAAAGVVQFDMSALRRRVGARPEAMSGRAIWTTSRARIGSTTCSTRRGW